MNRDQDLNPTPEELAVLLPALRQVVAFLPVILARLTADAVRVAELENKGQVAEAFELARPWLAVLERHLPPR